VKAVQKRRRRRNCNGCAGEENDRYRCRGEESPHASIIRRQRGREALPLSVEKGFDLAERLLDLAHHHERLGLDGADSEDRAEA
jgi:hypothetical protein